MKPHDNPAIERRFVLSLSLTGLIFLAELFGGWWTGSLALLSDAAHVFLDVFALGLSFFALRLSARPPDDRHTFGYHRLEVLAALLNGATLVGISFGIFREAWERWQNPQGVKSLEMLIIAVIGLLVNLMVASVLREQPHQHQPGETGHHHQDLNLHSAFLHVLGDAISSVGVILAAVLIGVTGWQWIDPLTSVLIGLIILFSSVRLLRASLHILVEGVPEDVSLDRIGQVMASTPGVAEIHDLHVWSLCSGHIALSAHAVLSNVNPMVSSHYSNGVVILELKRRLAEQFGIEHTTIEIENPPISSDTFLHQVQ